MKRFFICTDSVTGLKPGVNEIKFPIPTAPTAERSAIEGLVEQCLAARGENCAAWEAEINTRVFRLYALTPAEIELVKATAAK